MLRAEQPAQSVSMNDCLDERLYWLWKEVSLRLQVFSRRVQEGRDAEAASEFARFVRNAGIVRLMALSGAKDGVYAVDAPALDKAVSRLLDDCIAPLNGRVPQTRASAVVASYESLERKLDGLTEAVAKLSGQSSGSGVTIGGEAAARILSTVAVDDDDIPVSRVDARLADKQFSRESKDSRSDLRMGPPEAHARLPVELRRRRSLLEMTHQQGPGARRKTVALKLLK